MCKASGAFSTCVGVLLQVRFLVLASMVALGPRPVTAAGAGAPASDFAPRACAGAQATLREFPSVLLRHITTTKLYVWVSY